MPLIRLISIESIIAPFLKVKLCHFQKIGTKCPYFLTSIVMKGYGYLFGYIRLIKDTHHDEVFIEKTGLVVMRNNQWLHSYTELVAIANEMTK